MSGNSKEGKGHVNFHLIFFFSLSLSPLSWHLWGQSHLVQSLQSINSSAVHCWVWEGHSSGCVNPRAFRHASPDFGPIHIPAVLGLWVSKSWDVLNFCFLLDSQLSGANLQTQVSSLCWPNCLFFLSTKMPPFWLKVFLWEVATEASFFEGGQCGEMPKHGIGVESLRI